MSTLEEVQREVCSRHAAPFTPVADAQLCAVSVGVYDGESAQGVRYQAPAHMSGWYVTTGRYDGNHLSLSVEHVSHLIERRPDIAPLLALPPGFRFDVHGGSAHVWYDEAVAEHR